MARVSLLVGCWKDLERTAPFCLCDHRVTAARAGTVPVAPHAGANAKDSQTAVRSFRYRGVWDGLKSAAATEGLTSLVS